MINEMNEILVGFDLDREYSMISFYTRNNTEPRTVSRIPGEQKYRFPTPGDLYSLVEQKSETGITLLSDFFRECFERLATAGTTRNMSIMVTMDRMGEEWTQAITQALKMLDIPRERIFMQEHLESFYYYVLNQKKELWNYHVAMLEYRGERITGYELSIDKSTKPAFVSVDRRFRLYLDEKARGGRKEAEWNRLRDKLLLEKCQDMFQNQSFSSVYLLGNEFEGEWAEKTIGFVCRRRHGFLGDNLYVKGACYGVMERTGASTVTKHYLFKGPRMLEHNVGMKMMVRGVEAYQPMVNAGVSSFTAFYQCEFLLNGTNEVILETRDLKGEETEHTITLTNLPERPDRATRIRMSLTFPSKEKCRVCLDDLGLGELYPTSGKRWETTIEL